MSFNLAVILSETARRSPDQTVTILGDSRMSYGELDELSGRLAAGLD